MCCAYRRIAWSRLPPVATNAAFATASSTPVADETSETVGSSLCESFGSLSGSSGSEEGSSRGRARTAGAGAAPTTSTECCGSCCCCAIGASNIVCSPASVRIVVKMCLKSLSFLNNFFADVLMQLHSRRALKFLAISKKAINKGRELGWSSAGTGKDVKTLKYRVYIIHYIHTHIYIYIYIPLCAY